MSWTTEPTRLGVQRELTVSVPTTCDRFGETEREKTSVAKSYYDDDIVGTKGLPYSFAFRGHFYKVRKQ